MKNIFALFFVILLAGCATGLIVPAYNAELDSAVTKAHTQVAEITACIDLGQCASADSFIKKESNYTTALASLKTAKILAESIAPTRITIGGENAQSLLVDQITQCQFQLIEMSKLHKAGTTLPNIGITQPVDASCDMALRAIQALKR